MSQPTVAYFLGVGHREKSRAWLQQRLPETIDLYAAPQYLVAKDAHEIHRIGTEYIVESCRQYRAGEYVLCAESQAAPVIVETLRRGLIPLPAQLLLILPHGCNRDFLGANSSERRREIYRRARRFRQNPEHRLSIWGNRQAFLTILGEAARHFRRVNMVYEVGADMDSVPALAELAKQLDIYIYASPHDELFPYHEIEQSVDGIDLTLRQVSGGHLNRATPAGLDQLKAILSEHSVTL